MSCDVSLHANAAISALAVQLHGEPKATSQLLGAKERKGKTRSIREPV